jgi:hypothetical protein
VRLARPRWTIACSLCCLVSPRAELLRVPAHIGPLHSLAARLATKLLRQHFDKEQELAWRLELVRRRDALAGAEADAQAAQRASTAAAVAHADTAKALAAVKARLPQPQPPPPHPAPGGKHDAPASSEGDRESDGGHQHAGAAASRQVPPLPLQQLAPAEQSVVLSPELRRALSEAQLAEGIASAQLQAAASAAAAAGEWGARAVARRCSGLRP